MVIFPLNFYYAAIQDTNASIVACIAGHHQLDDPCLRDIDSSAGYLLHGESMTAIHRGVISCGLCKPAVKHASRSKNYKYNDPASKFTIPA